MKKPNPIVEITATGRYLPERVLTNADLERMVDTDDAWIVERTGIKERRMADDDMGAVAGEALHHGQSQSLGGPGDDGCQAIQRV